MASRSIDQRNAESVLPEPVGATTRACRPAAIASQAPTWAGVGAAKAASNQARVGSLNWCSTLHPLPTGTDSHRCQLAGAAPTAGLAGRRREATVLPGSVATGR